MGFSFGSTFQTFAFCETGIAQKSYVKSCYFRLGKLSILFHNGQNIYRFLRIERKHILPQGRINNNTVAYLLQTRQKR